MIYHQDIGHSFGYVNLDVLIHRIGTPDARRGVLMRDGCWGFHEMWRDGRVYRRCNLRAARFRSLVAAYLRSPGAGYQQYFSVPGFALSRNSVEAPVLLPGVAPQDSLRCVFEAYMWWCEHPLDWSLVWCSEEGRIVLSTGTWRADGIRNSEGRQYHGIWNIQAQMFCRF